MNDFIFTVLMFYGFIIPFSVNRMYNDSKARSFLRFYFAKRKCITWFAYIILIIISSVSLVYYFLFKILDGVLMVLIYYIIIPVCRFLFVSKRCKKGNINE